MSLYVPPPFRSVDRDHLRRLADGHPFATLVTCTPAGPMVSHVPVLLDVEASGGDVATGHLSRANPQAGVAQEALLILHGPDAYVSPGWYPDKAAQSRVPTWNYVVAHLQGRLDWFDDEAALARHVAALSATHERRVGGSWLFDVARPDERNQLRGIVGFRLHVSSCTIKAKLGQNHPAANQRAVRKQLASSRRASDRALAEWMRG